MPNPGAASTITANYQPLNSQQALVLIGVLKGLDLTRAGDTQIPLNGPIANFVPTAVVTANASTSVSAATVGIYSAISQGGVAVLSIAALTSHVSSSYVFVRAATAVSSNVSNYAPQGIFANVGTTVTTGTVDLYLYGYNLT